MFLGITAMRKCSKMAVNLLHKLILDFSMLFNPMTSLTHHTKK